ncbi:hypothetical protein GCM10027436_40110 [Actinophytocola sediminis]
MVGGVGDGARQHRNPVGPKEVLRLVLVQIHYDALLIYGSTTRFGTTADPSDQQGRQGHGTR